MSERAILFVCLGNICRSPAAEGVFLELLRGSPVASRVRVDSAGTAAYHEGESADARMRAHAKRRGYELPSIARAVVPSDFDRFDRILAMDASNRRELVRRAPEAAKSRVRLYRDYDDLGRGHDVPDPYYGGPEGFEEVLDIVVRCGRNLLLELEAELGRS